jgi:hypothetical protein
MAQRKMALISSVVAATDHYEALARHSEAAARCSRASDDRASAMK